MTILKITHFPEDVLRKQAETVQVFDEDLHKLIDDMIDTMRDAPGVGLAAPQVGISKRVIVVEFGSEDDETLPKQLYVMVNPEIENRSEETVAGIEGCLSVPGVVGEVDRSEVVTVRGQDASGERRQAREPGDIDDELQGTTIHDGARARQ